MGYDFDQLEEDMNGNGQEPDQQVPPDADTLVNEAERRISLAMYYRELTKIDYFQDGSEESRIIDDEIRQFARQRMEVLLGLKTDTTNASGSAQESPFTPEQVDALRSIAYHLLKKPKLLGTPSRPQPQRPQPPKAPIPRGRRPVAPTAPTAKQEVAAPVQQQKKPAAPLQVPQQRSVVANPQKLTPDDVKDGEVFKQGGKLWMWVTNEVGTRYRKDVTPQQRAPGAVPMPMGKEALEIATATLAQQSVAQGAAIIQHKLGGGRPDEIDMGSGNIVRNYDPNGIPGQ